MHIDELATPCLLVDLDVAESNIRKMAEYCGSKGCGLRPHVKGHKNPLLAKKQLDAGAVGLAAQTMEEAEAMVLNGLGPVLLTHVLASPLAVERFLAMRRNGEIMVTVDSPESARLIGKGAVAMGLKVDVLVEVNVGQNRTGVEPGEPAASLAQSVSRTDGLRFKGLMGYEGHLQVSIPDFEARKKEDMGALGRLAKSVEATKAKGLEVEIVSSGGTGTYNIAAGYPGVTEIQPGSYVMMDHRYSDIKTCGDDFKSAMHVLATVVSTPNARQAVVDMGWKACGVEYSILGFSGLPRPERPGLTYSLAGDEHGVLKCEDPSLRPAFGERMKFTPSHCDTTLNMYGRMYGVRNDRVEVVLPVARR